MNFTRRIVEMNVTESDAVLGYHRLGKEPTLHRALPLDPGTIAIWDNRCTQHFVLNDFEGERVIQRVTVMGDQVEAAAQPIAQPWVREAVNPLPAVMTAKCVSTSEAGIQAVDG